MSGVIATLCSRLIFSEIDPIIIYKRNKAINTKITTTDIDPQSTNLVKLSQVFLWFSLSIFYFCLALNFGFFLFIIYTLPLLLTNLELRSLFFSDFNELAIFMLFFFFRFNKRTYVIFQIYFSIISIYFIVV